jgi:hypothetical protein
MRLHPNLSLALLKDLSVEYALSAGTLWLARETKWIKNSLGESI